MLCRPEGDALFDYDFRHDGAVDSVARIGVQDEQTAVANVIDKAGIPPRCRVDQFHCPVLEFERPFCPGLEQAIVDICLDLRVRKRPYAVCHCDPLRQMAHCRVFQLIQKLRLCKKDRVEDLLLIGFYIRQEPDEFKEVIGQKLGLVDNKDINLSLLEFFKEIVPQPVV